MSSAAMAANAPPPPASVGGAGEGAGLPAVKIPPAVSENRGGGVPTTPAARSSPAPICVRPQLPSPQIPAHLTELSGAVAAPATAGQAPPVPSIPSAPATAAEPSAPPPDPPLSEYWSPGDEEALLNALRQHRRRHGDALPRGVDLAMAVFGRLPRTDYSLADLEAKIDALRRRFEETDAALCAGTGGPASGHDVKLYTLSLDVWGAAVTEIVAPKPAPPAPPPNPPAKKSAGRSRCHEPVRVPKRRRYEEMRVRCPRLAGMVEELMRKAVEGVSDVAAWSMEMRMKNQELAGGVAAVPAEDRLKELTGLMTRLV